MVEMTKRGILCPNVRLFPVISMVAGQEPVRLHESSGKSLCDIKSVLTARYCWAGTCNNGGHSWGWGMGQLNAWSKVEYSIPHLLSHWPFPVSTQVQPHLLDGLSNSLFTNIWMRRSSKQRENGDTTNRIFVLMFRFCK